MAIWFYSKSPEYGWLSNFSAHGFVLCGVRWPSVEHYYQAQKYAGTEVEQQIRAADTPRKARKQGQNRALVVRPDWDAVKEEVMRQAVQAKFEQNRGLQAKLVATGDEELRHESSRDSYWGCTREGQGMNRLGVILMEVRHTLQKRA